MGASGVSSGVDSGVGSGVGSTDGSGDGVGEADSAGGVSVACGESVESGEGSGVGDVDSAGGLSCGVGIGVGVEAAHGPAVEVRMLFAERMQTGWPVTLSVMVMPVSWTSRRSVFTNFASRLSKIPRAALMSPFSKSMP